MKRKQKRYTTEEQIIAEIDRLKAKLVELRSLADLDLEEQDKADKQARRIEDATLPRMKQTLAAFRTGLLTAITDDPAVV